MATSLRDAIFKEIDHERSYQNQKWGTTTDDTKNTPWMWAAYIAQYATRWMHGAFMPLTSNDTDQLRESMIKVAATAIAAVESIDRQRSQNGSHVPFWEDKQ